MVDDVGDDGCGLCRWCFEKGATCCKKRHREDFWRLLLSAKFLNSYICHFFVLSATTYIRRNN